MFVQDEGGIGDYLTDMGFSSPIGKTATQFFNSLKSPVASTLSPAARDDSEALTIVRNPGKVATVVDEVTPLTIVRNPGQMPTLLKTQGEESYIPYPVTQKKPWYKEKSSQLIIGGVVLAIAGLYVLRGKK
jgi:hypothetical protein